MSSVHLVLVLLAILAIPTQQEKACVDDITNCKDVQHVCEINPHVKKMCSRTCGLCNTNSKEYQVGPNGMLWPYKTCPLLARHPNSLQGCKDRCSHTDGCTAFNYVPGDNSRCELLECSVPVPEPTWNYGRGWVGYSLISAIPAVCSPECVNGACTAPNTCTCDQGWDGPQCQNAICSSGCILGTCTGPNICSYISGINVDHLCKTEDGSCTIDEKSYPNGQKWSDGCITYYCQDGDFYTDKKYSGKCGSCTTKNDPHFITFDGTTYDWHGQSTYTVAQVGSSDCPEIFVHSQFSPCTMGRRGATCIYKIHFQPMKNTLITIDKGNSKKIKESKITVDGITQEINVIEDGQLQIIKGPNNKRKPAFMWMFGGCLHIMAFDHHDFMIKVCDWYLKVFAHPLLANNLHGLCGDWNGKKVGDLKMRNGNIVNPPRGFWASKNVDKAFGNDWEVIGKCTEAANVELPTDPLTRNA